MNLSETQKDAAMFPNYQSTAEIARQRHTEMLRSAERHHRLFRRPMLVEPVAHSAAVKASPTSTGTDAPVIAMPAPRPTAQTPEARVA